MDTVQVCKYTGTSTGTGILRVQALYTESIGTFCTFYNGNITMNRNGIFNMAQSFPSASTVTYSKKSIRVLVLQFTTATVSVRTRR